MKDNTYFYCHVEGNTNVGCKRKANEDWLDTFECDNGLVAVVCDGMGGHVGGQVASHVAIDAIKNLLCSKYFTNPKEAIVEACNAANSAILQRATEQPELTGMGSTCVMLIVREGKVYMGSVGDSRIYLVRSKTIRQLTKDQSYVQMLVDTGQITQEQAEHHPRKNEITNALGLAGMQPATVLEDPINPEAGDCFLLCSDGLSGMVSDHEIAKVVSNQMGMSQQDRVNTLIDKARKNGGLDNITCQIVEFSVTPSGNTNPTTLKDRLLKFGLPILASLLLVSGISYFAWNYFHKEKKESEYVAEMRKVAKYISEVPEDTLVNSKNEKDYLEIEEIKGLGVRFYVQHQNGRIDTITSKEPLSISTITVNPDENLTVKKEGYRCTIKFNSREYTEPDLTVTFKDKDENSYCFVFAVINPLKDFSPSGNGAPIVPTNTKSEDAKKKSGEGTVLVDEMTNPTSTTAPSPLPIESTIKIAKEGIATVKLTSTSGTNTDQALYTDYAIQPGSTKNDWYEYTSDGRECTISIQCAKVPAKSKDAVIEIPLANTEIANYTIRVKIK